MSSGDDDDNTGGWNDDGFLDITCEQPWLLDDDTASLLEPEVVLNDHDKSIHFTTSGNLTRSARELFLHASDVTGLVIEQSGAEQTTDDGFITAMDTTATDDYETARSNLSSEDQGPQDNSLYPRMAGLSITHSEDPEAMDIVHTSTPTKGRPDDDMEIPEDIGVRPSKGMNISFSLVISQLVDKCVFSHPPRPQPGLCPLLEQW